MNITLQQYPHLKHPCLCFALPIAAAGAFLLWPYPQISKHTEGYCYLRCLLFSMCFQSGNHTSRSFICTWPWNTAPIFFSLTLPLQRFLGAHVKRLSADIYSRHCGARRYLRGPRPSRCVEGVPASRALLLSLLSWQQPNRMQRCRLLSSQPILSPFFYTHICPHITWPTSEEHFVTQIGLLRSEALTGWDMIKCPGAECWCCWVFFCSLFISGDRQILCPTCHMRDRLSVWVWGQREIWDGGVGWGVQATNGLNPLHPSIHCYQRCFLTMLNSGEKNS